MRDKILPDLVTDIQLATMLEIPLRQVQTRFREGVLPGRKLGRRWVADRRELLSTWKVSVHPLRAIPTHQKRPTPPLT